jgi:hypothetical protein
LLEERVRLVTAVAAISPLARSPIAFSAFFALETLEALALEQLAIVVLPVLSREMLAQFFL